MLLFNHRSLVFKNNLEYKIVLYNFIFFFKLYIGFNLYKKEENSFNYKSFFYFYVNFKIKIFYIGKSYKWIILKNFIKFIFNKSNKNIIFFNKNIKIKNCSKNIFLLKTYSLNNIIFFKKTISKIRKLNIFTGRGIGTNRSTIFRKKGKISAYN